MIKFTILLRRNPDLTHDSEYLAVIRPDEARFCDVHGCAFLITTENVVHA